MHLLLMVVLAAPAELRDAPLVLSRQDPLRIEHAGSNDSLGWISPGEVRDEDGLNHDRWFSHAMQLRARWLAFDDVILSASLGQVIYTPRSTSIAQISDLAGDRPYSGWLAASGGAVAMLGAPVSLSLGGAPSS